jgi:hypothetical protein
MEGYYVASKKAVFWDVLTAISVVDGGDMFLRNVGSN